MQFASISADVDGDTESHASTSDLRPVAESFLVLQQDAAKIFSDPYIRSLLQKWDMHKNMYCASFTYTRPYHKMQSEQLIQDLLNDPAVQQHVKVMTKGSGWQTVHGRVGDIDIQPAPCTLTRLDIFDKISTADPPIARASGDIVKCMDDTIDGFQVSDNLRDMLLTEASDNAGLYSEEEQSEWLWRVFRHLSLGGACCQFEDSLEPYLEATKKIYKGMLSVHKAPDTGKVEIASMVYEIRGWQSEAGISLFPGRSRNNFMYVTIDPVRRLCKVWYHAFVSFW